VEAGPGWGKTTAVRAAFPNAQYVEVPAGARPGSFHRAVLHAFGLSAADAGSIVARLATDADGVIRSILSAAPARCSMLVDDVQRLDPDGTRLVESLVDAEDAHLVLVGRSMAAFPVGSWMSRGLIGMPFGPDTLAFRTEQVLEVLGDAPGAGALASTIVSSYGGWPIAATLGASLLRRGCTPEQVLSQLGDGIAAVAGSTLADMQPVERVALIAAAVAGAHGIRPSAEQLRIARRLGFPESAEGLHEVVIAAVLKAAEPVERATVAKEMTLDRADPAAVFGLLAAEAPHALRERGWSLLAPLFDRYDRGALERVAAHPDVPLEARAAARCFLLTFSSRLEEAAIVAEGILTEAARRAPAVAVRLARSMAHTHRGPHAVTVLSAMSSDDPETVVFRDCLIGNLTGDRERLTAAAQAASRSGEPLLVARAAISGAVQAAHGNALDEAEGLAARGEDAARAGGSVLLEVRALKIRYAIAALRANVDLAAVHVGRLIALQELVGDPSERASDLVAAFEIEVLAGRAARAAAYDEAIRRIGPDWLGMETYAVCRSIVDAWNGQLPPAVDRLAAFASAAPAHMQRLPLALGAFLACAAGIAERGSDLLRQYAVAGPPAPDPFAAAHAEMAASFAAMAEVLLRRPVSASGRLQAQASTAIGEIFLAAARRFAAQHDISSYADAMRSAGFAGIAMMADACGLDRQRSTLSRAELSVLSYLASGMDAPRIASLTGRSIHTIKNQRRSIIGKLGAGNTLEAVAIARRLGLL
jgi:DNA-binding CsgD family transcriptional regulator